MLKSLRHDRAATIAAIAAVVLGLLAILDRVILWSVGVTLDGSRDELVDLALVGAAALVGAGSLHRAIRVAEQARYEAVEDARNLELHVAMGQALQAAETGQDLMQRVCRALVARGAAMAWVGFPDPRGPIEFIAVEGDIHGYLTDVSIRWDVGPFSMGPSGLAFRERRSVVVDDIATDPLVAPWRDRQLACGFRSSIALPLIAEDRILGVVTAYHPLVRSLRPSTLTTLERIAADLGRGLLALNRRAEAAAAARRLSSMLEGLPLPVLLVGPDSVIVDANRRAVETFGYAELGLVDVPLRALVPPAAEAGHADRVAAFHRAPRILHPGERPGIRAQRRDGSTFPADIGLAPVELDGRLHVICTVDDLTARKALESRLLQAEKMEAMGQFANILAHDFRNYLTAIGGFAQLLKADLPETHAASADVNAITDTVADATTLIRNVLAFAQPAAMEPEAQRCRIGEAVTATLPLVRRVVGPAVLVDAHVAEGLPDAAISRQLLGQVLLNLATNGRDAMPDGGHLRVTAQADGEAVLLIVRDTGTGMAPDVAARLFDPFFTTKAGGERSGTGLGLASVRLIVERAGGTVAVESVPGEGSAFHLRLPRAPDGVKVAPGTASPA